MNILLELTRTGTFATGQATVPGGDHYVVGTLQGDFAKGIRGAYLAEEDECDDC